MAKLNMRLNKDTALELFCTGHAIAVMPRFVEPNPNAFPTMVLIYENALRYAHSKKTLKEYFYRVVRRYEKRYCNSRTGMYATYYLVDEAVAEYFNRSEAKS